MGIGAPSFLGSRVGGEIATPIESCLAERRKQQELMRADRRRSYASHPVFGPLDPLQLKRCLSYAHMRHFPNGTTIFAKGVSGLRGHRCFFLKTAPPAQYLGTASAGPAMFPSSTSRSDLRKLLRDPLRIRVSCGSGACCPWHLSQQQQGSFFQLTLASHALERLAYTLDLISWLFAAFDRH